MKLIVTWTLALLLTTALATLMLYDNGMVSMAWGDWIIETSLSFFIGGFVVTFFAVYLFVNLLIKLWRLPKYWKNRSQLRRYSKAQNSMTEGMIALEYGEWHKAERALVRGAKHSETGLINYLSAAKMAQNQSAYERRDKYLQQARDAFPEEYMLIGLVEARLLLENTPWEALALLQALHEQEPKHETVLAEYCKVLAQLQQWSELELLMPKIKSTKALVREELWSLQRSMWAGKLSQTKNVDELDQLWHQLGSKEQQEPVILAEYIEQRIGFGEEANIAALIEKTLKRQWDDRLCHQFGRLSLGPAFDLLKTAEKWLKKQPDNPILLLTLGRLACRSQMWAMGKSYLKQSLKIQPQLETFHALARCFEAEGQESEAALVYKQAIEQLQDNRKDQS